MPSWSWSRLAFAAIAVRKSDSADQIRLTKHGALRLNVVTGLPVVLSCAPGRPMPRGYHLLTCAQFFHCEGTRVGRICRWTSVGGSCCGCGGAFDPGA